MMMRTMGKGSFLCHFHLSLDIHKYLCWPLHCSNPSSDTEMVIIHWAIYFDAKLNERQNVLHRPHKLLTS